MANATHDRSIQYIGARYVPKFYLNPDYDGADVRNNDWKEGVLYEALTIVTYNNDSYTSKKTVPENIGNPADNAGYWACTTKYTAALMALQTTVGNLDAFVHPSELDTEANNVSDAINELVLSEEDIKNSFELLSNDTKTKLDSLPSKISTRIVLDAVMDKDPYLQGGCYCGSAKVVCYFNSSNSNTGELKCFDIENKTLHWSYPVQGYHGNTLCYDPVEGNVYIGGYEDYQGNHIKKVVVFNIPLRQVIREIDAPIVTFGIAYDQTTETFYGIEGNADASGGDILYKFEGEFASIAEEIPFENAIHGDVSGTQGQGYMCIADNKIYGLSVRGDVSFIYANDIITGKCLNYFRLPMFIDDYRTAREPEAVIYDYENDEFYVTFANGKCGIPNKNMYTIARVGLYKNIPTRMPLLGGETSFNTSNQIFIRVENGAETLRPYPFDGADTFKCIDDALNVNRLYGIGCRIYMESDLVGSTKNIDEIYPYNNHFLLTGSPVIDHVYSHGNNNITFTGATFNGYDHEGSTDAFNIATFFGDVFNFSNCTFKDFTYSATHVEHIFAQLYSEAHIFGTCVFEGANDKFRTSTNSRFFDTMYQVEGSNSATFDAVADTYVYTGATITTDVQSMIFGTVSYDNNNVTGYIIASSGTSLNNTVEGITEDANHHLRRSAPAIVPAGTYYLWCKKAAAQTGASATIRVRSLVKG